ncbi:sigma-70 family RNA polymerase sigma factor [Thermaerobacillus caldiproteolyticus]|uniref:sigma-70 family RNA polymerase sigma factor n=1 Tax=Thermaerobacillus caldiproteolyticus TaxID=247480 RepID=UPI00188C24D2|nr:sigma-70 family RNA polymerase sigma factor [Anoxybacillus caldiproteolyticus]QPA33418.1 sigma-70 family RNA polymerase sigma factor [Anoxybacillus caldiproteolyticus]
MSMRRLILEYKQSLRLVRKQKEKVKADINKLEKQAKKAGLFKKEQIKQQIAVLERDKKLLSDMEGELLYAIEWMTTARRPGNRRGAERLSIEQRTVTLPDSFFNNIAYAEQEEIEIDEEKQKILEEITWDLTEREKDVFSLAKGEGFTIEYISQLLGISSGNVKKALYRAEKKIEKNIKNFIENEKK